MPFNGNTDAESVTLIVFDNGCGFSQTEQNTQGHYGLANIKKRASKFGGELYVSSDPGHGTSINLVLPLK